MDGVEGTQAGIGVSYSNSFDWMVSRQIRIFTINMGGASGSISGSNL